MHNLIDDYTYVMNAVVFLGTVQIARFVCVCLCFCVFVCVCVCV